MKLQLSLHERQAQQTSQLVKVRLLESSRIAQLYFWQTFNPPNSRDMMPTAHYLTNDVNKVF